MFDNTQICWQNFISLPRSQPFSPISVFLTQMYLGYTEIDNFYLVVRH
jgi:hypothetical protein